MKSYKYVFLSVFIFGMGCSSSAKNRDDDKKGGASVTFISCEDEYSIKNKVADSGLSLEIKQSDMGYEATLTKLGYVGTTLKKLPVKKVSSEAGSEVFEGKNFIFKWNGLEGDLKVSLDEAVAVASQPKPTKKLIEKMVCKVPGK